MTINNDKNEKTAFKEGEQNPPNTAQQIKIRFDFFTVLFWPGQMALSGTMATMPLEKKKSALANIRHFFRFLHRHIYTISKRFFKTLQVPYFIISAFSKVRRNRETRQIYGNSPLIQQKNRPQSFFFTKKGTLDFLSTLFLAIMRVNVH